MLNYNLKKRIERFCKLRAPEDTGNLRHNAINGRFWTNPNKFQINYSVADADYVVYLEEGNFAGRSNTVLNKHKRFITKTYLHLATVLENHLIYNNRFPRTRMFKQNELSGNPLRTLRHEQSLDRNRLRREVQ